jgi:hypothetical protein
MGGFSNYLESKIITDNFSNSAKYIGLFTDAAGLSADQPTAEANGTNCPGYARQSATFNSSGVTTNAQTFTATGAWATVRYVGIFDALTAGNLLDGLRLRRRHWPIQINLISHPVKSRYRATNGGGGALCLIICKWTALTINSKQQEVSRRI